VRQQNWNTPVGDLNAITKIIDPLRKDYVDSKILIYGGTGFIGTWLTESLVYADRQLDLHLNITVVTRNKSQARTKFSHPSCRDLTFIEHDFASSELNDYFEADYVIHGGTTLDFSRISL
jgi:nucleoside-diphosphate-sugar epimerase